MYDRLQIYVIYFLTRFKMKKIILFFITFLGIYTGVAQKPLEIYDTAGVHQKEIKKDLHPKNEPVSLKEKPSVKLFPNPAKNKVEIEIKGFEPGIIQVQLLANKGNPVIDDKRVVFSGNEIIVIMFSEKPGLYFLILQQGKKILRHKLIIR